MLRNTPFLPLSLLVLATAPACEESTLAGDQSGTSSMPADGFETDGGDTDDTDGGTDVDSATRDLDNRAPTVSVSLSPSSGATKTDTLTCTAVVTDDDDDSRPPPCA